MKVVIATMDENLEGTIERSGRKIVFRADSVQYPCGRATVRNTNRVEVRGTGISGDVFYANFVTVNEGLGRLGPGATPEARGVSEIEVRVHVTPGDNVIAPFGKLPLVLGYEGTWLRDRAILGRRGLDSHGDGDVDVTTTLGPFGGYSLYGSEDADVLSGGGSRATGRPVNAPVTLIGGTGHDRLTGGAGPDLIREADLFIGGGRDVLRGGDGNDEIAGGPGADKIFGGSGDDVFLSSSADGADLLNGGGGTDHLDYGLRSENLSVSIDAQANDGASGEGDNIDHGVERITTGSGHDTVVANVFDLAHTLSGGAGNDTFDTFDTDGFDSIDGGDGDDYAKVDGGPPDTASNVEDVDYWS